LGQTTVERRSAEHSVHERTARWDRWKSGRSEPLAKCLLRILIQEGGRNVKLAKRKGEEEEEGVSQGSLSLAPMTKCLQLRAD